MACLVPTNLRIHGFTIIQENNIIYPIQIFYRDAMHRVSTNKFVYIIPRPRTDIHTVWAEQNFP